MLRTLFVFAILIPGVLLALTSRFRALLLYLWFAFFRPQEFAWGLINNLRLSVVLGAILVIPALATGVFPNFTHPLSIGAILFFGTGLLAQQNAINQEIGWGWIDQHGTLTLVCLLAVTIIKTQREWIRTMAVAAGCLGFYGAKAGFFSVTGGGSRFGEGIGGAYVDNNAYAVVMVMTMPLLWVMARNSALLFEGLRPAAVRWLKVMLYASIPLCCYTLVSTFSRGGFLGFLVALFVYGLFQKVRKTVLALVLMIPLIPLVVATLPQGYLARIDTIRQLQEDAEIPREDVSEGRLHFWSVAVDIVQMYPLGIGMRNFPPYYAQHDPLMGAYGRRRDVHSSHFQVLVEHGFMGAAIWIWLNAYSFVLLWRIRKRAQTPGLSPQLQMLFKSGAEGLITSSVGFLVGGATISMALNDLTWLSFALVASLDMLSVRLCAEARQPATVVGPGMAARPVPGRIGAASPVSTRPSFGFKRVSE